MEKELKALSDRNTWKIAPASLAQDRPILSGKWVFRIKTNSDRTIERFKARWVVRGFDQEYGRDFTETFAPVSRHTSLRILLAIATSRRRPLRQIDVANAFLYALVDAEIFVEQPHGFVDDPSLVCQLLQSLYGIKQAPRLWQQYLHARLKRIGFNQLPHDQGMYRLTHDNDYVLLIVYVDDLLYIGSTITIVTWFERELQTDLSLTVSPNVTQYLGLNILDEDNAIRLSASIYASTIAERFCITPTHVATPYIGLTYHKSTTTNLKLLGYVDADHAADRVDRRSRTGYIYRLEPVGTISWQSSKQELVALSSAEAEYIALCTATKEGLYLRELLEEAKIAKVPNFSLFCDNQSAIRIANKNGFSNRTKHIALRYFFVKDEIEKGKLQLDYCPTTEMAADYLTKKLPKGEFEYCMLLTGLDHVTEANHVDTPETKGSVGNINA
ncbi:unnamed protein product [Closterium sp. NIES-53]